MHPVLIVLLTILAIFVLRVLFVFILAGGDMKRLGTAIRGSWRILRDPAFADKVRLLLQTAAQPAGPPKPSGAPLRLLRLLQRDGRFLDFVLENVQPFEDAQIAAAVREMQPKWQATLREHLVLEPVRAEPEGNNVEVPAGFDPSAIQLTGNVTGQPPFRGMLRHPGWRVRELKLAPPPEGQDEFVLMPAEVELP